MNLTRSTRKSKFKRLGELARINRKLILSVISIISCLALLIVSSIASKVDLSVEIDNPISYTSDIAFDKSPDGELEFYIRDYKDLQTLSNLVNSGAYIFGQDVMYKDAKYVVLNNITFPENESMNPIGYTTDGNKYFGGTFDGGGHTIDNLQITGAGFTGLFGYIKDAEIKNLTIGSGNIVSSGNYVGSVAGYALNSSITNVTNHANVTASADRVGGIVGEIVNTSKLVNAVNYGQISGNTYVGGLAGVFSNSYQATARVSSSANLGNITGQKNVGGLIGKVSNSVTTAELGNTAHILIENCFNSGNIDGNTSAGLIGDVSALDENARVFLTNAYTIGKVTSSVDCYSTVYGNTEIVSGTYELELRCVFYLSGRGGAHTTNSISRTLAQMTGAKSGSGHIMESFDNGSDVWEGVDNDETAYNFPQLKSIGVHATAYNLSLDKNFDRDNDASTNAEYITKILYTANDIVNLPEITLSGYNFGGWLSSKNCGSWEEFKTYQAGSYENCTGNITLTAIWELETFFITLEDSGTTIKEIEYNIENSHTIDLPDGTKNGYTFKGWKVDGSEVDTSNGYQYLKNTNWIISRDIGGVWEDYYYTGFLPAGMYGDVTLRLEEELNLYTLTFDENGGEDIENLEYSIEDPIYLQSISKVGSKFLGWKVTTAGGNWISEHEYLYENGSFNTNDILSNMYGNVTLQAQWEELRFTVTLNPNGGTVSPVSLTVTYGGKYEELKNPSRGAGYTFEGWQLGNIFSYESYAWENFEFIKTQTSNEITLTAISPNALTYVGADITYITNNFVGKTITLDASVTGLTSLSRFVIAEYNESGNFVGESTAKEIKKGFTYKLLFYVNGTNSDYSENVTINYTDIILSVSGYITSDSIVGLDYNHELVAYWTANEYTVTFDDNVANESITIDPSEKKVIFDSEYGALPIPTRTGYEFNGWYLNADCTGDQISSNTVVTTAGNHTLYAKWEQIEYTLTYNTNGGDLPYGTEYLLTYTIVTNLTLESVIKDGYRFIGWRVNADGIETYEKDGVLYLINTNWIFQTKDDGEWTDYIYTSGNLGTGHYGNVKLDAVYEIIEYTITLDTAGGTLPEGTSDKITYTILDTEISLPVPTKQHYVFDFWTGPTSDEIYVLGSTIILNNATGNFKVVAQYFLENYTVTYDENGGEFPDEWYTEGYCYGETVTLVSLFKDGYTFKGWKVTTAGGNWLTTVELYQDGDYAGKYGDVTLTAQFDKINYTITFNENGGDDIEEINYTIEDTITLLTPIKDGYIFVDWIVSETDGNWADGDVYTAGDYTGKYGNVTLTAEWSANTYEVLLDCQGGECERSAIYVEFDNLYRYYATEKNGTKAIHDTLPQPTKGGYTFDGWYTNDTYTGDKITASSTLSSEGITLYAKWEIDSTNNYYTIEFDENGGNEVSDITDYTIESSITLPTTSKNGYKFNGWAVKEEVGNWEFSVDPYNGDIGSGKWGNVTLTAQWTADEYSVTFSNDIKGFDIEPSASKTKYNTSNIGQTIELTQPTRKGYMFEWLIKTNTNGENSVIDKNTLTIPAGAYGNIEISGIWTEIEYTVHIDVVINVYGSEESTYIETFEKAYTFKNIKYDEEYKLVLDETNYYSIWFYTTDYDYDNALWGNESGKLEYVCDTTGEYILSRTQRKHLYIKNLTSNDGDEITIEAYYTLEDVPDYNEILNGTSYNCKSNETTPTIKYLVNTGNVIGFESTVNGFEFEVNSYPSLPTGNETSKEITTTTVSNVWVCGEYGGAFFDLDYKYIVNPYVVNNIVPGEMVYSDIKEFTFVFDKLLNNRLGNLSFLSYKVQNVTTGEWIDYTPTGDFATIIAQPSLNAQTQKVESTIEINANDVGKFRIYLKHSGKSLIEFNEVYLDLTINPKALTIVANSAEKVYDATTLTDGGYTVKYGDNILYTYNPADQKYYDKNGIETNPIYGLTVTVAGSQTFVGSGDNVITYSLSDTAKDFYNITTENGKLTVTKRTVAIQASPYNFVYNGYSAERLNNHGYIVYYGEIDTDSNGEVDLTTTEENNNLCSNVYDYSYNDGYRQVDAGKYELKITDVKTKTKLGVDDSDSYNFIFIPNEGTITKNQLNPWVEWLENSDYDNLDFKNGYGLGTLRFFDSGYFEWFDGIYSKVNASYSVTIKQKITNTNNPEFINLFTFTVESTTSDQTITITIEGKTYTVTAITREVEYDEIYDQYEDMQIYFGPTEYILVDLSEIIKSYGSAEYEAVVTANPPTELEKNLESKIDSTTPNLFTHTITLLKNDEGIDEVEFVGENIKTSSKVVLNTTTSDMLSGNALPISIITSRKITTTAENPKAGSYLEVTLANTNKNVDNAYINLNDLSVGKEYKLTYTCTSEYGNIEILVFNGATLEATINNGETFTLSDNRIYKIRFYTNASESDYDGTLTIEYIDISLFEKLGSGSFGIINKFNVYDYYTYLIQATYIYGTTTSEDVTIKATASINSGEFGGFSFDSWNVVSPILDDDQSIKFVGTNSINDAETSFYLPHFDMILESISKEGDKFNITYNTVGNTLPSVNGAISGESGSYSTQYTEIDTIILPEYATKPSSVMVGWKLLGVPTYKDGSTTEVEYYSDWISGDGTRVYTVGTEFLMSDGVDQIKNWNVFESGMIGDVHFEAIYEYSGYTFTTSGLYYTVSFEDENGDKIPVYAVYDSFEWTNLLYYQVGGEMLDPDTYGYMGTTVSGYDMDFSFVTYVDTIYLTATANHNTSPFYVFDGVWGNYSNYTIKTNEDDGLIGTGYTDSVVITHIQENIYISGNTLEDIYQFGCSLDFENPKNSGGNYLDYYNRVMANNPPEPPVATTQIWPNEYSETYISLPTPSNAPDGYMFDGWAYKTARGEYREVDNGIELRELYNLDGLLYSIDPETNVISATLYAQWKPIVRTLEIESVRNDNTVHNSGVTITIGGKTFTWNIGAKIKIYNGYENNWRVETNPSGQTIPIIIEYTYAGTEEYEVTFNKTVSDRHYFMQYIINSNVTSDNCCDNPPQSYTWDSLSDVTITSVIFYERFNITVDKDTHIEYTYFDWYYSSSNKAENQTSVTGDIGALYNSTVTLYAKVNPGYTFAGWTGTKSYMKDGVWTTEDYSITTGWGYNSSTGYYEYNLHTQSENGLNADYDLTSVATTTSYKITFEEDGGEKVEDIVYTIEDPITLPTTTKAGYTFNGWKVTTADGNWYTTDELYTGTVLAGKRGNVTLTAEWVSKPISVTIQNASGTDHEGTFEVLVNGESGVYNSEYKFKVGDIITITAKSNSDSELMFKHWVKGSTPNENRLNQYDSSSNSILEYIFTPADGDVSAITFTACYGYTANISAIYNSMRNNTAGGVNCTVSEGEIIYNSSTYEVVYYTGSNSYTVTALARENFVFVGWYKNFDFTNLYSSDAEVDVYSLLTNGHIYAYAKFVGKPVTVTLNPIGGTVSPTSLTLEYNLAYGELPTPTRNGYEFKGWYLNSDFTGDQILSTTTISTATNHTLYAKWEAIEYIIIFYTSGGTVSAHAGKYTIETTDYDFPIWSKPGYDFLGWRVHIVSSVDEVIDGMIGFVYRAGTNWIYETIQLGGENDSEKFYSDHLYTAENFLVFGQYGNVSFDPIYEASVNSITYDDNIDLDDDPTSNRPEFMYQDYYLTGNSVWISYKPTNPGYDFKGWKVYFDASDDGDKYEVTTGPIGHVYKTDTNWVIQEILVKEHPETLGIYYEYVDFSYLNATTYRDLYGSVTLIAQWQPSELTITLDANGGTVNPTTITVTYGEAYGTLPTPSRDGYTFAGWFLPDNLTGGVETEVDSTSIVTISSDHSLIAKWTANEYSITFSDDIKDFDTEPNTNFVKYSTSEESQTITLTPPTRNGYTFEWVIKTNTSGKNSYITGNNLIIPAGAYGDIEIGGTWTAINYTITFDPEIVIPNVDINPTTPKSTYNISTSSQTISITKPVKNGYTFVGWTASINGEVITDTNIIGFTAAGKLIIKAGTTGDIVLSGTWTPVEYTITYTLLDGWSLPETTYTTTYTIEDSITLPLPTCEGYKFNCWRASPSGTSNWERNYNPYYSGTMDSGMYGDVTLTIDCAVMENAYLITYDANGGTMPESTTYTTEYDVEDNIILPVPTKPGCTFTGWKVTTAGGNWYATDELYTGTVPAGKHGSVTLEAQWEEIEYEIYLDPTDVGALEEGVTNPLKYTITSTVTLPNLAVIGYTFNGWKVDTTGKTTYEDIDSDGNGYVYLTGTNWIVQIIEANEYFDYLYPAGTIDADMYGNVNLIAQWTVIEYTIKFITIYGEPVSDLKYTILGDAIDNGDGNIEYMREFNLPGTNRTGYWFGGWEVMETDGNWKVGSIYQPGMYSGMYGNVTLKEDGWIANSYYVIYNSNKPTNSPYEVVGEMSNDSFLYGTSNNLTLNKYSIIGYNFLGWAETSDGEVKYSDKQEVKNLSSAFDGEVTLYAKWEAIEYTIQFDPDGGKDVDSITYTIEDEINLPTTEKLGYNFTGWKVKEDSGNWVKDTDYLYTDGKFEPETLTSMYGDVDLIAQWEGVPYTIKFDGNGADGEMASIEDLRFGTATQITNTFKKNGYEFAGWKISGDYDTNTAMYGSSDGSLDVKLSAITDKSIYDPDTNHFKLADQGYYFGDLCTTNNGRVTFTAQWEEIVYTITYDLNSGEWDTENPPVGVDGENKQEYKITTDLTLSVPKRFGYDFKGWMITKKADDCQQWGNVNSSYANTTLGLKRGVGYIGNVTLQAQWEAKTYTVNLNFAGNTGVTIEGSTSATYTFDANENELDLSGWQRNLVDGENYYKFMWWSTTNEGVLVNGNATPNNDININSSNATDSKLYDITTYLENEGKTSITLYAVYYKLLPSYTDTETGETYHLIQIGDDLIEMSRRNISGSSGNKINYIVTNNITMDSKFKYYTPENIYKKETTSKTQAYAPKTFNDITLTSGTVSFTGNNISSILTSDEIRTVGIGIKDENGNIISHPYDTLENNCNETDDYFTSGLFYELVDSEMSCLTFDFNDLPFISNSAIAGIAIYGENVKLKNITVQNLNMVVSQIPSEITNEEVYVGGLIAGVVGESAFESILVEGLQINLNDSQEYAAVGGMIGIVFVNSKINFSSSQIKSAGIYISALYDKEWKESTSLSSGDADIGGFIGKITNTDVSEIKNVQIEQTTIEVFNKGLEICNVGGLVGNIINSKIEINGYSSANIYNHVTTSVDSTTGGLVGYASGENVIISGDSWFTHNLFDMDEYVSHLIGASYRDTDKTNDGTYLTIDGETTYESGVLTITPSATESYISHYNDPNTYLIPVAVNGVYTLSWDQSVSGYSDPRVYYWTDSSTIVADKYFSYENECYSYENSDGEITVARGEYEVEGVYRRWYSFRVPGNAQYISIRFGVTSSTAVGFTNVRLSAEHSNHTFYNSSSDEYQNVVNTTITGYNNVGGAVGRLTNRARVLNVNTKNVKVTGQAYVGGIVGYSDSNKEYNNAYVEMISKVGYGASGSPTGEIAFCTVNGGNINGDGTISSKQIGGIVGYMQNGSLSSCEVIGTTIGNAIQLIGGIVGEIDQSGNFFIVNSATRLGTNIKLEPLGNYSMSNIGGLIGAITNSGGKIKNSTNYATICVETDNNFYHINIGGLIGEINAAGYSVAISNCVNYGDIWDLNKDVAKAERVGGIIGYKNNCTLLIDNVINAGTVTGHDYISAFIGKMSDTNITITNSIASGLLNSSNSDVRWSDFFYSNNSVTIDANSSKIYYDDTSLQLVLSYDNQQLYGNKTAEKGIAQLQPTDKFQKGWMNSEDGRRIPKLVDAKGSTFKHLTSQWLFERDGEYLLLNNMDDINRFRTVILNESVAPNGIKYNELKYKLMFSNETTNPITSPLSADNKQFYGEFNGNNNILNIKISNYKGLFGYTSGAIISNLKVSGVVTGGSNIGGIVGSANGTTIKNCVNMATITGTSQVGGLVGYMSGGEITGKISGSADNGYNSTCENLGDVTGTGSNIGGIVGSAHGVTISGCVNKKPITGNRGVGGIAGCAVYGSTILTCRNYQNSVIGTDSDVGGIVGWANGARIKASYNIGSSVSGSNSVGGIVGGMTTSNIYGGVNTSQVEGNSNVGGIVGRATLSTILDYNDENNQIHYEMSNSGNVIGKNQVGGICGYLIASTIDGSYGSDVVYNSGEVKGIFQVGGIVGATGIAELSGPNISPIYSKIMSATNEANVWCIGCYHGEFNFDYNLTISYNIDNDVFADYKVILNNRNYRAEIGGIAGYSNAKISNVINSGDVLMDWNEASYKAIKTEGGNDGRGNYETIWIEQCSVGFGGIVGRLASGGTITGAEFITRRSDWDNSGADVGFNTSKYDFSNIFNEEYWSFLSRGIAGVGGLAGIIEDGACIYTSESSSISASKINGVLKQNKINGYLHISTTAFSGRFAGIICGNSYVHAYATSYIEISTNASGILERLDKNIGGISDIAYCWNGAKYYVYYDSSHPHNYSYVSP